MSLLTDKSHQIPDPESLFSNFPPMDTPPACVFVLHLDQSSLTSRSRFNLEFIWDNHHVYFVSTVTSTDNDLFH